MPHRESEYSTRQSSDNLPSPTSKPQLWRNLRRGLWMSPLLALAQGMPSSIPPCQDATFTQGPTFIRPTSTESQHGVSVTHLNVAEGRYGIEELGVALATQGSTLTCLNEVTRNNLADLKSELDTEYVATDGTNALLTNLPILHSENYHLTSDPDHRSRSLLVTTVGFNDTEIVIGVSHLAAQNAQYDESTEREIQINEVLEILNQDQYKEKAKILCMDLNARPGSSDYERMSSRLQDTLTTFDIPTAISTFPPLNALIDYIFISRHTRDGVVLQPITMRIWGRDPEDVDENLSDHCAQSAYFSVRFEEPIPVAVGGAGMRQPA